MEHFNEINACKYIYLGSIEEPSDNSLRILIEEAGTKSSQPMELMSAEGKDVGTLEKIQITATSHVYEVLFPSYISYSVTDESFALPSDGEIFIGRIFCIYEKSDYMDYLKKASFACDEHPGPFKQYGFNCLNHIVNIVSTDVPNINLIRPA